MAIDSLVGLFDNKRLEIFCSCFYFNGIGFSCFREYDFGIFKILFFGGEMIRLVAWEEKFFEVILGKSNVIKFKMLKDIYRRV